MDHQSHEPARFWYYYDFSPLQPGRYYCGDCFQLLPAIESGTVDMVLIDPPYYMGKDKAWDCFEGRADYMAFMGRAFIQAQRILKENGTLGLPKCTDLTLENPTVLIAFDESEAGTGGRF